MITVPDKKDMTNFRPRVAILLARGGKKTHRTRRQKADWEKIKVWASEVLDPDLMNEILKESGEIRRSRFYRRKKRKL